MLELYVDQIYKVGHGLLIAAIAYKAYKLASDAAKRYGRFPVLWKGAAWCFGIALVAALLLGQPSCDGAGDRIFGSCEHLESGFSPTLEQRGARFLYFFLLLCLPAAYGSLTARVRVQRDSL